MHRALAWMVVSLVGCGPRTAPAPAPVSNAAAPAPDEPMPAASGTVYCFSWIHHQEFSTDCFATPAICEQERLDMQAGSRDVTPACKARASGSCTTVGRTTPDPDDPRCFGDLANCERYREYVQGNGLVTTPCTSP